MQVHGRYSDLSDYGFMDKMGIWFENFGLPVVVNECLMQSYDGTIRLFPNWPMNKDAEFHNLRAVGAFLVSGELKDGKIEVIQVESEKGGLLKIILPDRQNLKVVSNTGSKKMNSNEIGISTVKGEIIKIYLD
jgi:hypothetical protein